MLLASRGDTLDTRVIVRFDSLPSTTVTSHTDTTTIPITSIDSGLLHLRFDSAGGKLLSPVTLSVYDVGTTGNDTSAAVLAPLFTSSRLVGSRTFAGGAIVDTLSIPLDNSILLARSQSHEPLRLGIQATSSASVTLHMYASESGSIPTITMRDNPDTVLSVRTVYPRSKTPTDVPSVAVNLADFMLVVTGTPPAPAGFLAVGGIPAKRSYLRFDIPSRLVDSSIVIRATLLLTQQGSAAPDGTDSMLVRPNIVFASPLITDPVQAAQIIAPSSFPLATTATFPAQGGVTEIELAPAFKVWALQGDSILPRAIVLMSTLEGTSPQQALFYSSNAAPELRPKLRVSYTQRVRIGTP
jgi:hypothetical protein